MAVTLQNGSTGLFDLQGKAFHARDTIYTALKTTIPTEVLDVLDAHEALTGTIDLATVVDGMADATESSKTAQASLLAELQQYCEQLLIELFDADSPLSSKTIEVALAKLIEQMEDDSDDVDASAIGLTLAAGGSNSGNGVIVSTTKRGDGLVNENALAEVIEITQASASSLSYAGEESLDADHADWPAGSGASGSLTVNGPGGKLSNADFEDESDVDNAPDDWVASPATIGTTLKMTDVEVQTVAISGTPTGGHYLLHFTNIAGDQQTTAPIAYNAAASAVQSALRALTGLESVTVSSSGTSPDYTHTITFAGAGGNQTELTSTDNMTGGSPAIAHATTTQGTSEVYTGGKAVYFESDGAELTALYQRVTLDAETNYALNAFFVADAAPAAGVFTVALVDGIGGMVINDSAGTANSYTFNASSLTTSWQSLDDLVSGDPVFRLPKVVPAVVYLKIGISTAVTSGRKVYMDRAALVQMTELYSGGPYAAAFSGSTAFATDDDWTLTVTNDRAGEIQEHYERCFGMRERGLLLPSDSGGTETIPDSVVG